MLAESHDIKPTLTNNVWLYVYHFLYVLVNKDIRFLEKEMKFWVKRAYKTGPELPETMNEWTLPPQARGWSAPDRMSLQWRHNECDGVPNLPSHECILNHLFGRLSKKT